MINSRDGDPRVFGRNVRAFRVLRGWSVRDLAQRAGVSTKTIVKIERGEGCTVRTEQKIASGFAAYVGRLWDPHLLSEDQERVTRAESGRWFFANGEDAVRYHKRALRGQEEVGEDRLRSDPDEIQNEAERHRLGRAGLATAFARPMGGGLASGYFQHNVAEIYARDLTPADGLNYTYLLICERGDIAMTIRDRRYELLKGDSMAFEGNDDYWIEPLHPIQAHGKPPLVKLICLRVLALPKAR